VLAGDGASVDLRGLDLPVGEQHHDTVVTVEHAASHGRSRQLFKAAIDVVLAGDGASVDLRGL
jgi:Fe-S cluster assembly scaffold protein SufB